MITVRRVAAAGKALISAGTSSKQAGPGAACSACTPKRSFKADGRYSTKTASGLYRLCPTAINITASGGERRVKNRQTQWRQLSQARKKRNSFAAVAAMARSAFPA